MKRLEDAEVKQKLFKILSDFADYCDEYGLRYYLCGGTLLGAIRHKDFIPWDDDVDILMPRPDYYKLHVMIKKVPISGQYQLISPELKNSILPFGKIIDKNIKVNTKFNSVDKFLWVDVFPMDGLPEDSIVCEKFLQKAAYYKKMFGMSVSSFGTGTTVFKAIAKLPALYFTHIVGRQYYFKKLIEMAARYDFEKSDYIGGIVWSCGPCERMKKVNYLPYVDVEFHGRLFHAPRCWDAYLSALYGEYMKMPSENKQYAHMLEAYME